jgi:RNA polymerase sigma-54 factor
MGKLTPEEERVALQIIGSLNDDGYFKIEGFQGDPLIRVAQEAGVSISTAETISSASSTSTRWACRPRPAGVPAIQARQLGAEEGIVGAIIKRHLKLLEAKNLPAIARELHVSLEEVIRGDEDHRQPRAQAGAQLTGDDPQYITPDVYVYKVGDKYMTVSTTTA